MRCLAIIPARGGSKRIPRKNIRNFLGRPIISYVIETALQCNIFSEVMVSTDDEEIATLSRQYGATIPFLRSDKNSNDFSTTADVIYEVLSKYAELNEHFDFVCCLYPTAPFINSNHLIDAFNLIKMNDFEVVASLVEYEAPIQRALERSNNNNFRFIYPEHINTRSQDLSKAYHDAGQFYWMLTSAFIKSREIWGDKTGAIVLPNAEVQDIDTEGDWRMAEMKYQILHGK